MLQSFQERYISREEHQKVVQYYTKLVANLYRQVCELRAASVDPKEIDALIEQNKQKAIREIHRHAARQSNAPRSNVITVNFARH